MKYRVSVLHASKAMLSVLIILVLFGCGVGDEDNQGIFTGSVTGTVTNTYNSSVLESVTVKIGDKEQTTDVNGVYTFSAIEVGARMVVASHSSFDTTTSAVDVKQDISVTHDMGLDPAMTSIKIINNTGLTIWYLYISESSGSSWGRELIGAGNYLYSGNTFTVTGLLCNKKYDMKVDGFLWVNISSKFDEYLSCDSTYEWVIE